MTTSDELRWSTIVGGTAEMCVERLIFDAEMAFTDDVEVSLLAAHGIGVDLAHVTPAIGLGHVVQVQSPHLPIVM